jgi:glycosyltransferase involved in cell wall biosynthesis
MLSIVVPCYNEEDVLHLTLDKLKHVRETLIDSQLVSGSCEIMFIDDGSCDRTWAIIKQFSTEHSFIRGLKLSRNVGHQNALLAGLLSAGGEMVVSIDADLQDDVNVIKEMVLKYREGFDIVYGVRKERDTDTFFKRFTAQAFYKLMLKMGVDIVYNHADYRLLSRRSIESLKEFSEVNIFIRGIVPLIGFRSCNVYYDRAKRAAGESKYPLFKMLAFAINGITSFSVVPLRLIALIGMLFAIVSMGIGAWALITSLLTDKNVPGWASTVIPLTGIGGLQLLSMGIVGEYIGKIYAEVKARPKFIIEEKI